MLSKSTSSRRRVNVEQAPLPAAQTQQHSGAPWERKLMPIVGFGAVLAIGWKLYRGCVVPTSPANLTVVFDVRRRSIFSASTQPGEKVLTAAPRGVFQLLLRYLLRPGKTFVIVPPGGFHDVFHFPRSALDPSLGVSIDCVLEDVAVVDGVLKSVVNVSFYIDVREIHRYLSIVGPNPPNSAIGGTVSKCLRDELTALNTTAGVMLNRQSRLQFIETFIEKLKSRLVVDCCVVMKDLSFISVELAGGAMM